MLGQIRDRATGWIAGVIVGALIISFAFWGVSFYFGGDGQANVATVNDTNIDLQTYQRAFSNLRRQMQQIFGDEISLEEEELIRQQTLQRLVDTEIINQIVRENNFQITDQQVAATITNLELFQDEEGFDRNKYEQGIASLGMAPAYFEQQLRMDLLAEQLQAGLTETLFVTKEELNDVLRMKNQVRDITYAIISIEDYKDEIEVSENDIQAYYDENKQRYASPEMVRIAYIDIDVEKIAENVKFTEQDLRDYYQNNKDQYDVAEQRSVTRLIAKTGEEATEDDIEAARAVIEQAMAMVNDGKTFEEIVQIFSEEGRGGLEFSENAFMTPGIMGDEIDEFLFGNDEGSVSDIIETESGLNIVKVGEIRGGPKNVFERVAEQIENDYRRNQAELQYFELADQVATLAYEHPATLEIAAEETGLEVIESDFFSRNNDNEDITGNDRIITESFKQERIDSGLNSDSIELDVNHTVIIRVTEHKPAAIQPLEDVREEIIADIKQDRAEEKVADVGEAIIAQLEAGTAPEEVQVSKEIKWNNAEGAKRDTTGVTRSVLRAAFQINKPANVPGLKGYSLGSGDYAVVMVTAVEDGDVEEVAETTEKATVNDMLRLRGTAEWREFLDTARDGAKIKIFEDNI